MIIDDNRKIMIVHPKDIDRDSVSALPDKVRELIRKRTAKYDFSIYDYNGGVAKNDLQEENLEALEKASL